VCRFRVAPTETRRNRLWQAFVVTNRICKRAMSPARPWLAMFQLFFTTIGSKAVTRIYFRGCWGTTQHSLYGRSPKGRGGVRFLGRTRRAPSPVRGLRERCKLPQWGPGRSLGRNRFWCISKLVEGIKTVFTTKRDTVGSTPRANLVTNSRSVFVCLIFPWNFGECSNIQNIPLVTALTSSVWSFAEC